MLQTHMTLQNFNWSPRSAYRINTLPHYVFLCNVATPRIFRSSLSATLLYLSMPCCSHVNDAAPIIMIYMYTGELNHRKCLAVVTMTMAVM